MVAGMLVALLGVSAFAIDLGWIYLMTSRVQKAADAAAMAGVVNLPGFITQATSDASNAAKANGLPITGNTKITLVQLEDLKLQVDLSTRINTYFLKVLGFQFFDISRRSTAQFVLPVPIGSPNNCFGEDPTGTKGCTGGDPNFWAAISGQGTCKTYGDAFATRNVAAPPSSSCSRANPQFRPNGYYFAIEVGAGSSGLTVDIYDAGFYDRIDWTTETGDNVQPTGGGTHTHFQVYNVDNTPLNPANNPPISGCRRDINSGSSASTYKNRWVNLCTVGGGSRSG
jgi:hypothetical protein